MLAMLWLVLKQLRSKDPQKRRLAAERLAAEPDARALEGLSKASQDKEGAVRIAALGAIGVLETEAKFDIILRALNDPEAEVRQAAVSQLKDTARERVQSALADALRDSDAGVRGRAARLLESSPWHANSDEDEMWLAIARGKFARAATFGSIAIKPLESVFQGGPYHSQVTAIEALGSIPDERVFRLLARALKSPDHTVCMAAVFALMNSGSKGAEAEIAPLLGHQDHRIRVAAVEALARLDMQPHADVIRSLLRDPTWDVRGAAAAALAKIRDVPTVDALVAALQDQNGDVRAAAAMSLGRIGDERSIGPLVLALKDGDSTVRKMAAGALPQIDADWAQTEAARSAAPELRTAMTSSDWFVRRAAGLALEQMGEKGKVTETVATEIATPARRRQHAMVSLFEEMLRDADADLRLAAAESLGRIGDDRARSSLMSAMKDADDAVRRAANEALTQLHVE
jgi:HEAT repeat protein